MPTKTPKIVAVASAADLDFRYGCTPAWWQLWKGLHEVGVDLIVTTYRGKAIESPWWRTAPNPLYREAETFARARDAVARLKGDQYLRRAEESPDDTRADRAVREIVWRYVTPRWRKHLEALLERERDVDAVIVFTVPMSHFRGIPSALRERFDVPVVFYDGDVPMSLPEFGGMDTGFNYYHGAEPEEYDLVLSNSEGGLERLRELGARRAEAVFWAADPELFHPLRRRQGVRRLLLRLRRQVQARVDGGARRRAVAASAGRGLRARRPRLPRRHRPRARDRRRAVQRVRACDLGGARQPQRHAALARDRLRVVDEPAVRARCVAVRRSSRTRSTGWSGGSSRGGSCSSSSTADEAVDAYRELLVGSRAGGGARQRRARARARRAHVLAPRATRARARRSASRPRPQGASECARSPSSPR